MGRAAAGLADQLEPGQPRQQGRGDRRALANQHQRIGLLEALDQRVLIGNGVVVNRHLVACQLGEGIQVAHTILVIIGNDNVHQSGSLLAACFREVPCFTAWLT